LLEGQKEEIDLKAKTVVPALTEALKDEDEGLRSAAAALSVELVTRQELQFCSASRT